MEIPLMRAIKAATRKAMHDIADLADGKIAT